jgi:hypothetical protein
VPIERRFLDWNEGPLVDQAVRWMLDGPAPTSVPSAGSDDIDLDHVCCVTPGRRAGRLIIHRLAVLGAERGRGLVPPHVVTPGALPEVLLAAPDVALATDVERELAWEQALAGAGPTLLERVAALPEDGDLSALAGALASLRREVVAADRTFDDVVRAAIALGMDGETERWRALSVLDEHYRGALDRASLADPDDWAASAIRAGRFGPPRDVVLAGVPDLTRRVRALLEAAPGRVTALVFAPADLGARFDGVGAPGAEAWAHARIELGDERIVVADRPADQAAAVIRAIGGLAAALSRDDVAVGLGDEDLAEPIARAGRSAGLALHHASGRAAPRTAPWRLLAAAADWLAARTAGHLAALVRHPDLESYLDRVLRRSLDAPSVLDRYRAQHFPAEIDGRWRGSAADADELRSIVHAVDRLLGPLAAAPRPLGAWAPAIVGVLRAVYAGGASARGPAAALAIIRDAAAGLAAARSALAPASSGADAIRRVLRACAAAGVPDEPDADAIEMLGWLELLHEPAPAIVVAGVNEGSVPSAVRCDPFLSDALRRRAGLPCAAERYARDAYVLDALAARGERLLVVAGRRSAEGEPLLASRLLLAVDDGALAERVRRFCDDAAALRVEAWPGAPPPAARSEFRIPDPPAGPIALDHLSVTAFKAYLECPYRFWLRRIERLRTVDDEADELSALDFGSFAHAVLAAFGVSLLRLSGDAAEIAAFLRDEAADRARARFGPHPPPAIAVQLARLEQRFDAFAIRQAEHRRAGWTIRHVEHELGDDALLDVPGEAPLRITGTVDRVDERDGEWLVLDYKTGDRARSADEAHRDGAAWIDLQLPLYRHFAERALARDETPPRVSAGYFTLPREGGEISFATWKDDEQAEAVGAARAIVRAIRAGDFAPSDAYPYERSDEFRFILHRTVLGVAGGGEDEP